MPAFYKEGVAFFSETDDYIENYEKIAKDHLQHQESTGENPFIPEDVWNEIERGTRILVNKYLTSDSKILDVGVGLGRLLQDIEIQNEQKFGMDISLVYLLEAKKKGIEACFSKIEDMPYRECFFDLIVCTDVLEHVIDLNCCINKILSVLKSNGFLIIRVPYKENLRQYTMPECPYEYVHLRNFDEDNLNLLFTKIFGCKFHERTFSWGSPSVDSLIHSSGIRFLDKLKVSLFKRLKKFVSTSSYQSILSKRFHPVECNYVVSKPRNL